VAAYFDALPRWSSPTVQFTDVGTAHAAAESSKTPLIAQ
jgi:hypothetical protein